MAGAEGPTGVETGVDTVAPTGGVDVPERPGGWEVDAATATSGGGGGTAAGP